jgi:hypothetical protein
MPSAVQLSLPFEGPQPPTTVFGTPAVTGLMDPNWVYIPSWQTDIVRRFKAMGWVPPSELKALSNSPLAGRT